MRSDNSFGQNLRKTQRDAAIFAQMAEHLIKVFGERNTGTRAALTMLRNVPDVVIGAGYKPDSAVVAQAEKLRETVEDQFRAPWKGLYLDAIRDMECVARGQIGAWKHSRPTFEPEFAEADVRVLFMVRDPYSWALSLFRKPYHRKGPRADRLDAFVDQPWMTERRDYMPCVLASPLELWNEKLRAYLAFCETAKLAGVKTQILRFEDFISDPVAEITAALNGFGVAAIGVEPVQNSTKNQEQLLPALQTYYRQERWLHRIDRTAAERIEARIDWDIAAQFGYSKRSLSNFQEIALTEDPQGELKGARVGIDPKGEKLFSIWDVARKRIRAIARP